MLLILTPTFVGKILISLFELLLRFLVVPRPKQGKLYRNDKVFNIVCFFDADCHFERSDKSRLKLISRRPDLCRDSVEMTNHFTLFTN